MNTFIRAFLITAILTTAAGARAGCDEPDIKGTWVINTTLVDVTYLYGPAVLACKVRIDARGQVSNKGSRCTGRDMDGSYKINIYDGEFIVKSSCAIEAVLDTDAGLIYVEDGQLAADQKTWQGEGYLAFDSNIAGTVVATRR